MRSLRRFAAPMVAVVVSACDRPVDPITGPSGPRPEANAGVMVTGAASPQVGAGYLDSCALRAEGTIACWGSDERGVTSPPAGTFAQFDMSNSTACALSTTGTVACWGLSANGQASPPAPPAGLTFTQVGIGTIAGCAVRSDGALACWGVGDVRSNVPSGSFTQVTVGYYHACAIRDDGAIVCWGRDDFGAVTGVPQLAVGRRFVQVATGRTHNCAVVDDGSVVCWGNNTFGQLNVPVPPGGVTYAQVSVSSYSLPEESAHSCALRSDGTIVCWGSDRTGALTAPALPMSTTYTNVASGSFHNCASRSDGVVVCWGWNGGGQLGVPETLNLLKHTQPIVFSPPVPETGVPGTTFELVPNAGSGSPVVLAGTTPDVCTITGRTLSLVAPGTCSFTADRDGSADYEPAPQLVVTVTVAKGTQTIAFAPALPGEATIGTTLTVSATGGASGNPVTFSVVTPATCALNGTTLSLTVAGACTVAANQVGNAMYEAAPQQTATVGVRWPFSGFAGLAAWPAVNQLNAGATLELRFSLGTDRGLAVLAAGSPTVAQYTCEATPPAPGSGAAVRSPGKATPLVYSTTTGLYTYTWKTEKSSPKGCYQLSLRLTDGGVHTALFQFR